MITEFLIAGAVYGTLKYFTSKERRCKRDFREIVEKAGLYNKQEQTLLVHKVEFMEYGYKLNVGVPYGIGIEDIQKLEDTFKTNLGALEIQFERDTNSSMVNITVITEPLKSLNYEPVDTKPGEILAGYNYKDYVKIDLNKFPHMLVGGDTGTGKSRLMLLILTNLINRFKDIDIYLIQIRKSDLAVFKDCKQVNYMARDLQQTRDILKHIDTMCMERDATLEKCLKYGVYNISDYNQRFKNKEMQFVYVVLDEFAFFNYSGADTKEEKQLKKEILGYIKNIVLTGRSTGIFIFTSLQKPTSTSIPTDIKSQLTTRISFKMLDKETSVIVLGNANATELKERQAIVRTLEQELIKVPFIDHNLIMQYIKDSIEPNHKYIKLENTTDGVIPSNPNNDGIIDLTRIFNANS